MPYSYHKEKGDGVVVTKKDSGKVVGHTTPGKLKAYLAALHIHTMSSGGEVHECSPDCKGYAFGGIVKPRSARQSAAIHFATERKKKITPYGSLISFLGSKGKIGG